VCWFYPGLWELRQRRIGFYEGINYTLAYFGKKGQADAVPTSVMAGNKYSLFHHWLHHNSQSLIPFVNRSWLLVPDSSTIVPSLHFMDYATILHHHKNA